MSGDEIRDELQAIFRDVIDDEVVITDELTANDVERWDSLAHINLIYAIEDQFGIEFTQAEMADMANVGELQRHVVRKLAG
ncbi:acyl carrier protein [Ilumatobacter nonamiensis]|uniref:acyl carrier protein n=1 Tax=Ilumatobacter nonamiensis TaxID=467093 RepID=UPI00034C60E9|nr:acyl carrier protein [Ilumatobacter nonamiensis]